MSGIEFLLGVPADHVMTRLQVAGGDEISLGNLSNPESSAALYLFAEPAARAGKKYRKSILLSINRKSRNLPHTSSATKCSSFLLPRETGFGVGRAPRDRFPRW
jgi:hypothetical protein